MADDLTPDVTLTPDPNSKEAEIIANEEREGEEPEGTEVEEQTPKVDYEERYKESQKEALRLLEENKKLQEISGTSETRLKELETEKEKLESVLNEEKPEVFDSLKTKNELETIKKDLILQKETNAINEYIDSNPDAKKQKEVLRKLGRANPKMSYQQIWDDIIEPIRSDQVIKKPKVQSERGGKTQTPGAQPDLNGLSLEERKAHFKKMGL